MNMNKLAEIIMDEGRKSTRALVWMVMAFLAGIVAAAMLCGCQHIPWEMIPTPDKPGQVEDASEFPAGLTWLHTNVSGWPATAMIESVTVSGSQISFPYTHARVWPAHPTYKATDGGDMNGNVWVIAEVGGRWYAVTWEWLKVGQSSKHRASLAYDHIKRGEFANWRPQSGDRIGFMVSGFARSAHRTVQERSNVVWVIWP